MSLTLFRDAVCFKFHSMKQTKKAPSVSNKTPRRAKHGRRASGIRETEEARALLEDQMHGLYWWIFNAFRIKGFIRAKALDELQRASGNCDEPPNEKGDSPEADGSPEKQRF